MLNSIIIKINLIYVQYNFFSASNSRFDNILCLFQGIRKLKTVVKKWMKPVVVEMKTDYKFN